MTRVLPALLVTGVVAAASVAVDATAHAAPDDFAVNGVFTLVSDGQWSKTNERMEPRPTVTATWTVNSSCSTFEDCTGTVSSDHGWTADLVYQSGRWRAARNLPDWLPCADGTTAPGDQSFIFWPRRRDVPDRNDHLIGWDETVGPSGACGINRWVTIRMPLTLTRVH